METCFPILDPALAARVKSQTLDNYLADNLDAWALQPDGSYLPVQPVDDQPPHSAQAALLATICG